MSRPLPSLPLLLFRLDGHRFALPAERVERVLPMVAVTPLPGAPPIVQGAVNVHGRVVGVVDTRRRLGWPPRAPRLADRLVIAASAGRTVALPVDQVDGVLQAAGLPVVEPGRVLPGLDQVQGLVTLADGLVVIDDLDRFLSLEEGARLDAALGAIDA